MHEFLEELPPKFNKVFKSSVKITEVTVFSLQLSPKEALVMTNRQVYLLKKGFWGIKAHYFPLNEVKLKLEENRLSVISEKNGFDTFINIPDNKKKSLLAMALKKFKKA